MLVLVITLCVLACWFVSLFVFFPLLHYESPGVNQVDGLPPASHTDAVVVGRPGVTANMYDLRRLKQVSFSFAFRVVVSDKTCRDCILKLKIRRVSTKLKSKMKLKGWLPTFQFLTFFVNKSFS